MSGDAAGSITNFFAQLRAGDAAAAGPIWERFVPRLRGLAQQTLGRLPQRAADADDAVQSAFASFWQRAARGDFGDALDRNELWNLLATITVRKSLRQVRREHAVKRGGGHVLDEAALAVPDQKTQSLDDLAGRTPATDFDLHCEELLLGLDDELRQIAILRLMGYQNREIAEHFHCTERRIERKLNLIRMKWQREAPSDAEM